MAKTHSVRRCSIALVALATIAAACAYSNTTAPFCTANGQVDEIVIVGDIAYFGGTFTQMTSANGIAQTRRGLGACLLSDGSVTAFDANLNAGAAVNAIATSDNGDTVFVGGTFTRANPQRTNALAIRPSNNAIRGWLPTPAVSKVNDIIRVGGGSNETLYLGGTFGVRQHQGTDQTGAGNEIAAFDVDVTGTVHAMALSSNGARLYLGGGNITAVNGTQRSGGASVNATTGATTSFAPVLSDPGDDSVKIYDIIQHSGYIYYCGDWWQTEGIGLADKTGVPEAEQDQRNVNRFAPLTGVVDRSWWPYTNGGVQACAIDASANVLLIGGHFDFVNGVPRADLATLSLEGGALLEAPPVEAWDPDTQSIPGTYAAAVANDGSAVVGGVNQLGAQPNGVPSDFIARFAPAD